MPVSIESVNSESDKKGGSEGVEFYDNAVESGGFSKPISMKNEYPQGNPSEKFENIPSSLGDKSKNVLDIGCGRGDMAIKISKNYGQVFGLDLSKESIKSASKKTDSENIKFIVGDSHKLPFEDDSFDVVYVKMSTHDPKEIYRVLEDGGYALSYGLGEKDALYFQQALGYGQKYKDKKDAVVQGYKLSDKKKAKWEEAGLVPIEVQEYEYDSYFDTVNDLISFLEIAPIATGFNPKDPESCCIHG